jgi:hypothetical protein
LKFERKLFVLWHWDGFNWVLPPNENNGLSGRCVSE